LKNDKSNGSSNSDKLDGSSDIFSERYERDVFYLKDSKIEVVKARADEPIKTRDEQEPNEKPVKIKLRNRTRIFLRNKELISDFFCCLLIVIICFVLLRGTLREGYPRTFLDGTMAYYFTKVKMLLNDFRFYTESWYFGFELLRFYPPLSAIIPYIAAVITGMPLLSYYYLSFIFYSLFCLGNYFFISKFLDSRSAGLFAGVVWALTHSNVVSFQGHYWEIARLSGTFTLPWFLLSIDYAIRKGEKRWILIGIGLASYTLLTNMYSVFDLILFSFPFLVIRGWFLPIEHRLMNSVIRKRTVTTISTGILGVFASSFWWILPAALPYGIYGYIMGEMSIPPKLQTVLFQFNPPDWMPATQVPVTILGLFGFVLILVKQDKKGASFFLWLITTTTSTYIIHLQSVRMLPLISLSLVYLGSYFISGIFEIIYELSNTLTDISRRHISTVLSVCIISLLVITYMPVYSKYATVNNGYLNSDEYRTALWLKDRVNEDYRVYVMYGKNFRGAQWINVFTIKTKQVLGGNDFGPYMVDRTPFVFDDVVKKGINATELFEIASQYNVKYIVIDDSFMKDLGPIYTKFFEDPFVYVEEINNLLSYAKVFEVKKVKPISDSAVKYEYWDIWRIIGVAGTGLLTFLFARRYKKMEFTSQSI
jgi:hypothetical protein